MKLSEHFGYMILMFDMLTNPSFMVEIWADILKLSKSTRFIASIIGTLLALLCFPSYYRNILHLIILLSTCIEPFIDILNFLRKD